MKHCDRGLKIADRGRRPRALFSTQRSQFFTIQTDHYFFHAVKWLTSGFVYAILSLRAVYKPFVKNLLYESFVVVLD